MQSFLSCLQLFSHPCPVLRTVWLLCVLGLVCFLWRSISIIQCLCILCVPILSLHCSSRWDWMILTIRLLISPAAECWIGSIATIRTLLLLHILSAFLLRRHGLAFSWLFSSVWSRSFPLVDSGQSLHQHRNIHWRPPATLPTSCSHRCSLFRFELDQLFLWRSLCLKNVFLIFLLLLLQKVINILSYWSLVSPAVPYNPKTELSPVLALLIWALKSPMSSLASCWNLIQRVL